MRESFELGCGVTRLEGVCCGPCTDLLGRRPCLCLVLFHVPPGLLQIASDPHCMDADYTRLKKTPPSVVGLKLSKKKVWLDWIHHARTAGQATSWLSTAMATYV
jgi:hypothetical protein